MFYETARGQVALTQAAVGGKLHYAAAAELSLDTHAREAKLVSHGVPVEARLKVVHPGAVTVELKEMLACGGREPIPSAATNHGVPPRVVSSPGGSFS